MQLHANAALSLNARRRMVAIVVRNSSIAEAAERFGVSVKTCRKWCRRFLADGELGLLDRSSAPARSPHQTPAEGRGDRRVTAVALHRPEIAETLNMALSTVTDPGPGRDGQARPARPGARPAL